MKFNFDDDMTWESKTTAILNSYGISTCIHPDFYDVFVKFLEYGIEYAEDDFNYTYSVEYDVDTVKWIAELLAGKEVEATYPEIVKELNKEWLADGDYKVISYEYRTCRLVLFEDYRIETIA